MIMKFRNDVSNGLNSLYFVSYKNKRFIKNLSKHIMLVKRGSSKLYIYM